MRTKKTTKKMGVKDLVTKVSRKRQTSNANKIKEAIMKMIRNDPQLYKKVATQGSVSTIVDRFIPLSKELIQHPKLVDELYENELMKQEILENPVVVTQLLQIPEVTETIVREPSFLVDILQDASKLKSLTKSLSKSSTQKKQEMTKEELLAMQDKILEETKPRKWTLKNSIQGVFVFCMKICLADLILKGILIGVVNVMDLNPVNYKAPSPPSWSPPTWTSA